MYTKELILCVLTFMFIFQCSWSFLIPDVTLEAYEPKGFRASIPALQGIQMVAFHGNKNKPISQVDPGEFSQDFTSPTDDNMWAYVNDDLDLKVGDVINYWIFVQYERMGYRKDAQSWKVTELIKRDATCQSSSSRVSEKSHICKNGVILEDDFTGPNIDESKWKIENYIPNDSENFEFVSYQNKRDVCYINENKLFIKPQYAKTEDEVRGKLDLRESCTRQDQDLCYQQQQTVFILPPVTSSQIVSLTSFKYGKVEIKAKLPAGDWIYPQMYLQEVNAPNRKLWISYARGNDKLLANSGVDIGSRLLFGGPVFNPQEPDRSTYLRSKRNNEPFTSEMHTYTVIWTKDRISLQEDGSEYGHINTSSMEEKFAENDMARLVLGVGVGGINDFPDNFKSGQNAKPWRNKERLQTRKFFDARNIWSQTWVGESCALQVEYVKISAV